MPLRQARYVAICQQLLAVAMVLAALAPAADVISLEVVPRPAQDPVSSTAPEQP